MEWEDFIAAFVAVGLLVYLSYALIYPEKF